MTTDVSMLTVMPTDPKPPVTLDEFARRQIKRWLHSTNTTQTHLAEQIGRNQAWMSRYLAAEYDADLETLRRMALVFGHTLTSLLGLPSDPDEAEVVGLYRALTREHRAIWLQMLRAWTGTDRKPAGRKRRDV